MPAELRRLPRWVRWSASKVPLQVDGRVASSTDRTTWTTWARANASSAGVGVGFVLNGDGIVCLDLDDVLDEAGQLVPAAAEIVSWFPGAYVEVSPSGRGLHVWGRSPVQRGRRGRVGAVKVEVYPDGRYITVTGRPWAPGGLVDISAGTAQVLALLS